MKYRHHTITYLEQIRAPEGGIPLDPSCVYGVDTESFYSLQLQRLHTAMVQTADDLSEYCDEPLLGESPFEHMVNRAFDRHSIAETGKHRPSKTKLRREPGSRGTGRVKLPRILFCFYNAEYDIQRLFLHNSAFFNLARVNIEGESMKVAILCEFSGIVRDAFIRRGHDAISFDLLPTESPGPHIQEDVTTINNIFWSKFDLAICHPPCTHLAVSGARWFKEKRVQQEEALTFVQYLMNLPIPKIAIENPVSIISSRIRKPDQIIQPWQFGHGETKATCLWLKNLPLLSFSKIVEGRESRIHKESPGPDRWKNRSRTYQGIADAMANQWGNL